ncbi:MAG: hypothetical protein EXR72_06875 [Myxococcales bacterium]|nr:hypothetical protein [Myxococcales bacterium]
MIPPLLQLGEAPRTPQAEVRTLIAMLLGRIAALRDLDPRLCDLILPTVDLEATMRFVPGAGLLEAPLGRAINQALRLPADGASWPVAFRADIYREAGASGASEFLDWQMINRVGERADRHEQVHLYSVIEPPDGSARLAVSRRRRAISESVELPDKSHDRYSLTTTRIHDWRADRQFLRPCARSAELRRGVADAPSSSLQLVRTDMDRPFQQPVLRQVGARSHNYYALNLATGDRAYVHYFDFWLPERPRPLVDAIGRLLAPHELGHYEVWDYRETARTATWDPTLHTGLRSDTPLLPTRAGTLPPPRSPPEP